MARQEEGQSQNRMPVRAQQEQGRLVQSPFGWGSPFDIWGASPFQLMRRMREDMDRLFGSFLAPPEEAGGIQSMNVWAPRVDLSETDSEFILKAEVPGVVPEDLEVICTDDMLVLRGETRREDERQEGRTHWKERRFGRFERQIPLPPGTDPDQVQANFRNGVLELRISKTEEARQRVRRIPIGGIAGAKGGQAGTGEEQAAGQQNQAAREQNKGQAAGQQGSSGHPKGA
jgi:HSP20 family protein